MLRVVALAAAAGSALALSACSDDPPAATAPSAAASPAPAAEEPAGTSPSPAPEPPPGSPGSGSASGSATRSPTAGPSAPAASPSAPTPAGLAGRLLPAAELPGLNESFTWREQATSAGEPAGLARCHRFPLASLGATRSLTRTYLPAGPAGPPARHLVAQFPDRETAARAYDVLGTWHRECRERLARYDLRRVGALEPVAVPAGLAGWYLLTYGPLRPGSDDAVFESTGIAVAGDRVAVLDMRVHGQDFNYPPGREPMVSAVQRASALLR